MEARVYDQFARLQHHFWFEGRRRIFFDLIRRQLGDRQGRVLEIGCGPGGMLEHLRPWGAVHGLDVAQDAMRYCSEKGLGHMVAGSGASLPYADASFDFVGLFDVIEHIDDEVAVMREVKRVLKPGGTVFISVPAYQWLFSQNDRVVHHKRRYTARMLRGRIEAAGLKVAKLSYFNTLLFPLICAAVLVLKLKERWFGLPPGETNLDHEFKGPVNRMLGMVMGSERLLLRHTSFPFGHSLLAMAH